MSCKHNFSLWDDPVLMKLYTVEVYNIMCIEEESLDRKYCKGDNK